MKTTNNSCRDEFYEKFISKAEVKIILDKFVKDYHFEDSYADFTFKVLYKRLGLD